VIPEALLALAGEVARLLPAGATAAAGLRKRLQAVRGFVGRVPALSGLVAAGEHVLDADAGGAAPAVLDLLLMVRQVQAGLAGSGLRGTPAPLPPAGPWFTTASADDVLLVAALLAPSIYRSRYRLESVLANHVGRDLRLLNPLLACLDERGDLAGYVSKEALPGFGRGLVPELLRTFDPRGAAGAANRLAALCRLDPAAAAERCRAAAARGSEAVQIQALQGLRKLDLHGAQEAAREMLASLPPPEKQPPRDGSDPDEEDVFLQALRLLRETDPAGTECLALRLLPRPEVRGKLRGAALAALGDSRNPAALEVLLDTLTGLTTTAGDLEHVWEGARAALVTLPQPQLVPRLLGVLAGADGALEALPLPPSYLGKVNSRQQRQETPLTAEDLETFWQAHLQAVLVLTVLSARPERRALRAVLGWTEHPVRDLRHTACYFMQNFGDKGVAVLPELTAALRSPDEGVRRAAAGALGLAGPKAQAAVPALVAALQDPTPEVRERAAAALGWIGHASRPAVRALAEALSDGKRAVACEAAGALERLGPGARAAAAALAEAVRTNGEVRWAAAKALAQVGVTTPDVIDALAVALRDGDSGDEAASALGKLGKPAVPGLLEALTDPQRCGKAARALGEIGLASKAVVAGLAALLQDRRTDVRSSAAEALGKLGPAAGAAVAALREALHDRRDEVCRDAAEALGKIGPPAAPAVPGLVLLLKSKGYGVKGSALEGLGSLGAAAEPALPAVIDRLHHDEDAGVRWRAAWTLGNLGPVASSAVPALVRALQDRDGGVREWATRALGLVGPAARAAVGPLLGAIQDTLRGVRACAAVVLGKLGAEAAVPALVAMLGEEEWWLRRDVADALARIGTAARGAVAALTPLLGDPEAQVRQAAKRALKRLQRRGKEGAPA
jgi:HEAT repeat protein